MRHAGVRDAPRDAGEAIVCASRIPTRTQQVGAYPQPDGTKESADWQERGSAGETSMRSGSVRRGASGTALVKRIEGMRINNPLETT